MKMQCVDLAKTEKPIKSKAVKGIDLPSPAYYYHDESVYDLALRNFLLKGYENFKVKNYQALIMCIPLNIRDSSYTGLTHT